MGKAMKRGMVLVLSLWDDMLTKMDWLDSETPSKIHPKNFPGTKRGPCSMQAGDPNMLRSQSPNSKVHYTNIMVGEIDSTYGPNVGAELLDVVATPAPTPAPTLPPWQQQPVQPVPAVPAALQPMTPAEQVTGGMAVNGFCCFYGPNPSDMCANCQSKDSSPWNANPINCAKSGGKYCSGIVRLFSTEKELPAVEGRSSPAKMPLGARLVASGLCAACGLLVMALAFVLARRSGHGYTAVGETHNLLQASEIQDE